MEGAFALDLFKREMDRLQNSSDLFTSVFPHLISCEEYGFTNLSVCSWIGVFIFDYRSELEWEKAQKTQRSWPLIDFLKDTLKRSSERMIVVRLNPIKEAEK